MAGTSLISQQRSFQCLYESASDNDNSPCKRQLEGLEAGEPCNHRLRLSNDFGNNFGSALAAANKANSLAAPKRHGFHVALIVLSSRNCLVTNHLVVFPGANDNFALTGATARGRAAGFVPSVNRRVSEHPVRRIRPAHVVKR